MPERILTRHFVRRFLDNDLLSPDADSLELVATISAALIAAGLFLSTMMGISYLSQIAQSPARTAVPSIDNRVFLFGCSMHILALAALAGWNTLSLDNRDLAILGPLPLPRQTVVRAKLAALVIVGGLLGGTFTAVTSLLFPILMIGKLPLGLIATAKIVLAQVCVSIAAGAFGFLAVLAVRESLHAVLGGRLFARVSVALHASMSVAVLASFLMLPGLSQNVASIWLANPTAPRWMSPPVWFAGLYEYLVGGLIMSVPRPEMPRFIAPTEERLAMLYGGASPVFPTLAAYAVAGLVVALAVALPAYWWNNRSFDGAPPAPTGSSRSGLRRLGAALVNRTIVRNPAAQAGFWFALHCAARSLPHRMSLVSGVALGIAAIVVGFPFAAEDRPADGLTLGLFVPELVTLGAIVVGFYRALGLPADLRASWIFHLAWRGNGTRYLAGIARLAILALIVPAALILLPLQATFLGLKDALAQAWLSSLVAAVFVRVLLLGVDRLPFACARVPSGTLRTRGPVYLFASIAFVWGIAALERAALASVTGVLVFAGVAVFLYAALGVFQRGCRCEPDRLDAPPVGRDMTLQLGLGQ